MGPENGNMFMMDASKSTAGKLEGEICSVWTDETEGLLAVKELWKYDQDIGKLHESSKNKASITRYKNFELMINDAASPAEGIAVEIAGIKSMNWKQELSIEWNKITVNNGEDADQADNKEARKSAIVNIIQGTGFVWKPKLWNVVATSEEAKCITLVVCTCEFIWIRTLGTDNTIEESFIATSFDNIPAADLSNEQ